MYLNSAIHSLVVKYTMWNKISHNTNSHSFQKLITTIKQILTWFMTYLYSIHLQLFSVIFHYINNQLIEIVHLIFFLLIFKVNLEWSWKEPGKLTAILDSIVVSIPACHAGDRGSIPRLGVCLFCESGRFINQLEDIFVIS